MDSTPIIRQAVKQTILKYGELRPSHGDIRLDAVIDEERDRYALLQAGWDRGRRVKGMLIYIVIADGKAVIEYDGLENGVTDDLTSRGVPEDQIVYAYMSEATA